MKVQSDVRSDCCVVTAPGPKSARLMKTPREKKVRERVKRSCERDGLVDMAVSDGELRGSSCTDLGVCDGHGVRIPLLFLGADCSLHR